jgi:ribosomal protein L13
MESAFCFVNMAYNIVYNGNYIRIIRCGSVALTGLSENDIVVTYHHSLFKDPDNATELNEDIVQKIHSISFYS